MTTESIDESASGGSALTVELGAWVPVAESLPSSGRTVLACYRNGAGMLRRIRAVYVAAKTSESHPDSEIGEYDEASDTCYDPEGWYEQIDNWDDYYSAVAVCNGEVTHWMPMPEAPNVTLKGFSSENIRKH